MSEEQNSIDNKVRSAQISLINEVCMKLALDMASMVDSRKIPTSWDGHELRAWIAKAADRQAQRSCIRLNPSSERSAAYAKVVESIYDQSPNHIPQ